jgi:hypothetical protein
MIRLTFALFCGLALLWPAQVSAQTPDQSMAQTAAQLAARTSSLLPRRATVSLELQTLTPIPSGQWSSFRKLLQDELHKAGVATDGVATDGVATAGTPPESGLPPRVLVTLSEDARGLLLVAEVFTGDNRQIAMLPWKPPSSAPARPRFSITRKLLWTQTDPILDILLLDSDSQMLILSTDEVASYRLMGDKWMPSADASLVLPRPLPRDPRGRLAIAPDGFRAYLPGSACIGALQPQFRIACAPGNETWPGGEGRWVTDRNVLESDAARTPFYTAADGLYASGDGHVRDRAGQPVAGSESWGSDMAAIADPCGPGAAVIASSANGEREEVRVYEVTNGQATPASEAMPLSGPVTALWPAESSAQLPAHATLVVRNSQTGQYEASRLGLACTE